MRDAAVVDPGGRAAPSQMTGTSVRLREVRESDIETFHAYQADPESAAMAAFQSRDRETSYERWRTIMAADDSVTVRAIVVDQDGRELLAGHIISWTHDDGVRELGYWIGRELWGKGIASAALKAFLGIVTERPVYAWAAAGNIGSQRVLEKNGFVYERDDEGFRVFRLS